MRTIRRPRPLFPRACALVATILGTGCVDARTERVHPTDDAHLALVGPARPAAAEVSAGPPSDMVFVPEGMYLYGSDPKRAKGRYPDEALEAPVRVKAFWIDKYEFPNKAGVVPERSVSWRRARLECERLGKRLCSEVEWEAACEGPGGAAYGYGDAYDPKICPAGKMVAKSGSAPGCVSPLGVYDLVGNVAEWTYGRWKSSSPHVVARSGAYSSKPRVLRCANRIPKPKDFIEYTGRADGKFGFRCCKGEPLPDYIDDLVAPVEMYAYATPTRAHGAPASSAPVEKMLTPGDPVMVVAMPMATCGDDPASRWFEVRLPDGRSAFVCSDALAAARTKADVDLDGKVDTVLLRNKGRRLSSFSDDGDLVGGFDPLACESFISVLLAGGVRIDAPLGKGATGCFTSVRTAGPAGFDPKVVLIGVRTSDLPRRVTSFDKREREEWLILRESTLAPAFTVHYMDEKSPAFAITGEEECEQEAFFPGSKHGERNKVVVFEACGLFDEHLVDWFRWTFTWTGATFAPGGGETTDHELFKSWAPSRFEPGCFGIGC